MIASLIVLFINIPPGENTVRYCITAGIITGGEKYGAGRRKNKKIY